LQNNIVAHANLREKKEAILLMTSVSHFPRLEEREEKTYTILGIVATMLSAQHYNNAPDRTDVVGDNQCRITPKPL